MATLILCVDKTIKYIHEIEFDENDPTYQRLKKMNPDNQKKELIKMFDELEATFDSCDYELECFDFLEE